MEIILSPDDQLIDLYGKPYSLAIPYPNSPVSQLSFPNGEQPEQRISALKSEQPTAGCIAILHKYRFYMKLGGVITDWNLWNPWGYVNDM